MKAEQLNKPYCYTVSYHVRWRPVTYLVVIFLQSGNSFNVQRQGAFSAYNAIFRQTLHRCTDHARSATFDCQGRSMDSRYFCPYLCRSWLARRPWRNRYGSDPGRCGGSSGGGGDGGDSEGREGSPVSTQLQPSDNSTALAAIAAAKRALLSAQLLISGEPTAAVVVTTAPSPAVSATLEGTTIQGDTADFSCQQSCDLL